MLYGRKTYYQVSIPCCLIYSLFVFEIKISSIYFYNLISHHIKTFFKAGNIASNSSTLIQCVSNIWDWKSFETSIVPPLKFSNFETVWITNSLKSVLQFLLKILFENFLSKNQCFFFRSSPLLMGGVRRGTLELICFGYFFC